MAYQPYQGSDGVQYTSAYVHILENYQQQGRPTPISCVMVFRTLDTSGSWTSPGGRYDAKTHRPDIRATAQHFLAELTRNKLKIPVKELGTLRQFASIPLEGEGHARVYGLHIPAQSVNQAFFQVTLLAPSPAPSSSPLPPPPLGTV